VKPKEVFYGTVSTSETMQVEMSIWKPDKAPTYDAAKSYVVYVREKKSDAPTAQPTRRWLAKYGTRSIQPDTAKLRNLLKLCLEAQRAGHSVEQKAPPVDVAKLSPIEKKLHSIILPEVDFACANVNDIFCFFQCASVEYDHSDTPADKKGVNFLINSRTFTEETPPLCYYLEGGSLLQNLEIVTALFGERHELDDWVVLSKKGSGPPKPNLSLGPQGTNSALYKLLSTTIIPEVEFRQAGMSDVAKSLAKASHATVVTDTTKGRFGSRSVVSLWGNHTSALSVLRILSALCPIEVTLDDKSATIRPVPSNEPEDDEEEAAK
jgi:hypothetical protein